MLARIDKARQAINPITISLENDEASSPIARITYIQNIEHRQAEEFTINIPHEYIDIEFHDTFPKNHSVREKIENLLLTKFKHLNIEGNITSFRLKTGDIYNVVKLLGPTFLSYNCAYQLFSQPKSLKETCVGFIEKAHQAKMGFWSINKTNIANLNNDIKEYFSQDLKNELKSIEPEISTSCRN